jgi:hypothetical protein
MAGYLGGQPVIPWEHRARVETARWYHPGDHPAQAAHIRYGELGDGRWYVEHTNMPGEAYAFAVERDAELAVTEMLARRTGWVRQL